MRVGWLMDEADYVGGAELTMAEFAAAAPEGVELVECPAGGTAREPLDAYVIGNCVTYTLADLEQLEGRVVKFWHDVGPHVDPEVRAWLDDCAQPVCCSPIQAEFMGLKATCIPPPVDLRRFEQAAGSVNGDRRGAVSIAQWRNFGKAPQRVAEWAAANGPVDFYGTGFFAPHGSRDVPYDQMPSLLASYEKFVFLPTVIEPFGRLVAEAWAAGCGLVVNDLVGAKWWITERPEAIESAGEDFWKLVLS